MFFHFSPVSELLFEYFLFRKCSTSYLKLLYIEPGLQEFVSATKRSENSAQVWNTRLSYLEVFLGRSWALLCPSWACWALPEVSGCSLAAPGCSWVLLGRSWSEIAGTKATRKHEVRSGQLDVPISSHSEFSWIPGRFGEQERYHRSALTEFESIPTAGSCPRAQTLENHEN